MVNERFNVKTTRITDNGMEYEVTFYQVRNKQDFIDRGGVEILDGTEIFKIKKDGTRGRKLTCWNNRLWEVVKAAR